MPQAELSTIPPFASPLTEESRRLEKLLHVIACPAGEVLLVEGCSDDKFYILLEGQMEVVKALGSREERGVGLRGSGNLLGEMSLFSREGFHTASERAVSALRLLQVSHRELDSLLQRQPKIAYEIIRQLSQRLQESEDLTIQDLKEKNRQLKLAYEDRN
jgi:CRP/FNR family transcriptional regulator